jgi:hypothetical protein
MRLFYEDEDSEAIAAKYTHLPDYGKVAKRVEYNRDLLEVKP